MSTILSKEHLSPRYQQTLAFESLAAAMLIVAQAVTIYRSRLRAEYAKIPKKVQFVEIWTDCHKV